jgi:hypothetical protein
VPGGAAGGTGPNANLASSNTAASENPSYVGLLAGLAVAEVLLLIAVPAFIARRRRQGSSGPRQVWRIGR